MGHNLCDIPDEWLLHRACFETIKHFFSCWWCWSLWHVQVAFYASLHPVSPGAYLINMRECTNARKYDLNLSKYWNV